VLARAMDLFWKHGPGSVSTRDLEAALGIRAPAIYRRFRSKDELLARSIDHYVDAVVTRRIQKRLRAAEDPVEGLRDFFVSTLQRHGREKKLRGCLLANTATLAEGRVPEVHAAIRRGLRLTQEAFREQIVRAQATGQVAGHLDPETTSQVLVMSLQGLLTLIRLGETDLEPGIDAIFDVLVAPPAVDEAGASS